ncbi:saccharopine dehydrogenase family protein [Rhodococcus sp. ARC_M6]|uniref:saccharopine dehydrogenase family protein n=1 Tax=Rhodococcus sp. ARC_M6 TaxID=2928852 RepID=UPI001FB36AFB|nr:saccharopine dehydrogenase NADP-binding domain-containing protein [Rhodococcus sp. ARC_M6]MCJ0905795.1 saccharopine dehydrogenase NADP-binding domain-containing protein [Rhodococcus sp. ARC_M6]
MTDSLHHRSDAPILIVGGYGTVGTALTHLAAPKFPILLAGRNPAGGAELARTHGVSVRRWDLGDPTPFDATVRAVVSTVNDPHDRVLRACIEAGVPYVDITRWTGRVARAATLTGHLAPTSPVYLSSGWMGGVTNLVAAALVHELGGADEITISIRYDTNDRAGRDSVDFIDRLGQDYEVMLGGNPITVSPLTDTAWVEFPGSRTKVARIDTPEQLTFPMTMNVQTATTRIGFSSNVSTNLLLAAKKAGLFRWGRGNKFTPLRRALLYSPGTGGSAQVRIDVSGPHGASSAVVVDPNGQAHLTAVGGYLALRRVLGNDMHPGVAFPESVPHPERIIGELEKHGVAVLRT